MNGDLGAPSGHAGTAGPATGCESVSDALAASAGGDDAFEPATADHLASCLRCRVEQSRYRRLMDAMRCLRDAGVRIDARLESQILTYLDRHGQHRTPHARSRLAAAVGGVAAGAAATAGVIAFTARHRRAARLAS